MALKYKTELRNAKLDAIETYIGTAPVLRIFTGTAPTNVTDADSGTKLVDVSLPSDWLAAASGGSKAIAGGPWSETSAEGTGTAGYFRIYQTGGTVCCLQGSCGMGTGDLQLDNTSITTGQTVNVTAFTITDGNG
jgi:hypothetical protein